MGDNQAITVDVRVVCATHRSLEDMVKTGDFREDLLFRINTFEIAIPPLRDRRDDIPVLVEHFVRQSRPQAPAGAVVADAEALTALAVHHWPGNIRELANVVEHALVLCDELPLVVAHLPARFGTLRPATEPVAASVSLPAIGPVSSPLASAGPPRPESLRELEMRAILEGLERNKGNKARTAEELGISLKTLYNKLHQLNEGGLDKTG